MRIANLRSRKAVAASSMLRAGALAALLGVLNGCGMVGDETASRLMVTPGKYHFHNCKLLVGSLAGTRSRIDELQKLQARASQGPAGQAIGAAAYRTEYLQARGDEKEILAEMAEKNCKSESTWTSDRSMY